MPIAQINPGRRSAVEKLSALIALSAAGLPLSSFAQTPTIRIGVQQSILTLVLLRNDGVLEKSGVKVEWTEFLAGLPIMEAIQNNTIDFGIVGIGPPIFAQANGMRFAYVGYERSSFRAVGLLVHKYSPLQSIADLKGKKIAFTKGSNAHGVVISQLKNARMHYSDIQPVYLFPKDALAAFKKGEVDAWAVWDPFLAYAEEQLGARQLNTGEATDNYSFLVAAPAFAQQNRPLINSIISSLNSEGQEMKVRIERVADEAARLMAFSRNAMITMIKRTEPVYARMDANAVSSQQKLADDFFQAQQIPKKVRIRDVVSADFYQP